MTEPIQKIPAPAPGYYTDVPYDEYRAWDALNISTLVWATCSMEHVKACLDGDLVVEDTEAKLMGSAMHARILEPEEFSKRFVVSPGCQAKLKSGKNAGDLCGRKASFVTPTGAYLCGTHATPDSTEPTNLLTADQFERLDAINQKVRSHPVVKLIRQHGGFECSIVWERQGVLCKARLDKYIFAAKCPDTVIDLKKVSLGRGGNDTFGRAIKDYHLHMKAAWYVDAAKSINGKEPCFIWIVVEEKKPFGVNVIHCDAETMKIGHYLNSTVFEQFRLCMERGEWPGYADDIHLGGLPEWELRNFRGLLDSGVVS